MELCTARAFSNLSQRPFFASLPTHFRSKTSSIPFKPAPIPPTNLGFPLLRSKVFDGTSDGANQLIGEERDVVVMEDVPPPQANSYNESVPTEEPKEDFSVDAQTQAFEFLDKLNIKFDPEDSYSILLYGTGVLSALWFASAIVGAIDSIPIFPKLMEVVGLAYTLWFSSRYLLFKKNRDELATKIEEIKQQVLGGSDD